VPEHASLRVRPAATASAYLSGHQFSPLQTWGGTKPHYAAVRLAQDKTRIDVPGMVVQLSEPGLSGRSAEAGNSLQHMLRRAGYPDEKAAGAWVARRHEEDTASTIGYDPLEGTYGVHLHPWRWDYGTMGHEAVHLITNHQEGWPAPGRGHTDAEVHGPRFAENYELVIRTSWGDIAADAFRQHHRAAVTLVSRYRRRILDLPGIEADYPEPDLDLGM
jgi:hypothetical protein